MKLNIFSVKFFCNYTPSHKPRLRPLIYKNKKSFRKQNKKRKKMKIQELGINIENE